MGLPFLKTSFFKGFVIRTFFSVHGLGVGVAVGDGAFVFVAVGNGGVRVGVSVSVGIGNSRVAVGVSVLVDVGGGAVGDGVEDGVLVVVMKGNAVGILPVVRAAALDGVGWRMNLGEFELNFEFKSSNVTPSPRPMSK